MSLERTLRRIGFSATTYLETVTVFFGGRGIVNIAPLGFILKKSRLVTRVFRGSKTYELIAEGVIDRGRICITEDATLFYLAMFKKEEAIETFSKFCRAYVDFDIDNVEPKEDHLVLYCKPIDVEIIDRIPKGFTRASAAIIEALVWLSKIPYVDERRKRLYRSYIRMCIRVVHRSSRSRKYKAMARDISVFLRNLIAQSE